MKKFLYLCTVVIFTSTQIYSSLAVAETKKENCLVEASSSNILSLGFPVAKERLSSKKMPRVLVIPIRLSDTPDVTFDSVSKERYFQAGTEIENLSKGIAKIEFKFSEIVTIKESKFDLFFIAANQKIAHESGLEGESTFGFVRRVIEVADSSVDFSGIDAVVIQGPELRGNINNSTVGLGEAMQLFQSPSGPWLRSIETEEGSIFNVVLVTGAAPQIPIITHELLHNFGLTDLYGGKAGPGQLSIMDKMDSGRLLSFEKWILGWIPLDQVECIEKGELTTSLTSRRIVINSDRDDVFVIKDQSQGRAVVIETSTYNALEKNEKVQKTSLSAFVLNNEARPPIEMVSEANSNSNILINDRVITDAIGKQIDFGEFVALISDISSAQIFLDLIPKSRLANEFALIEAAIKSKAAAEAKAKAEAEAKAKAEAEAKAKAEAEAKAKAEADAKASISKKRTITCVKGKLIKKVIAANPKCPRGYKRK